MTIPAGTKAEKLTLVVDRVPNAKDAHNECDQGLARRVLSIEVPRLDSTKARGRSSTLGQLGVEVHEGREACS